MIVKPFRRSTWRRASRLAIYLIGAIFLLDLYTTLTSYKTFNHNLAINTITRVEDLPPRARNQKVYIVAQFWTSAEVIVDHWAEAVFHLIDTLGSNNIYLSVLESGSLDNTVEVLEWFDNALEEHKIQRTIILDPTTHDDAVNASSTYKNGTAKRGWIYTGDSYIPGEKELRRIPYLAELRNRGLEPMLQLQRKQGITFDKILYLNDVIFQPSDVLTLLATNDGIYDVACAIDFHHAPQYYDTFALRDSHGYATATRNFPFFRSGVSRGPMMKGLPAPVKSCWNGMVLVDAAPYYDQNTAVNTYDLDGTPTKSHEGLRFRGIPDTLASVHLEGSECCLIHADLIHRGQAKKGIYMNPAVRVGYIETGNITSTENVTETSYDLVHTGPDGIGFITSKEYFVGVWRNRYTRWTRPAWLDVRNVGHRLRQWKKDGQAAGEVREEVGVYCTVDEMQILTWYGWKHVW